MPAIVEYAYFKFQYLCSELDLRFSPTALTNYICDLVDIERGDGEKVNRRTFCQQLRVDWNNKHSIKSLYSGVYEPLLYGLGINPQDESILSQMNIDPNIEAGWFAKCSFEQFKSVMEGHVFPTSADFKPVEIGRLILTAEDEPKNYIGDDYATIDVFSTAQFSELTPLIHISTRLIRIPAEGLAYGFTRLLIDLQFESGRAIRLSGRVGTNGKEFFDDEFTIEAWGSEFKPQFNLSTEAEKVPLELNATVENLGELKNVKPGDRIKVTLRAEVLHDMVIAEGDARQLSPKMEEIYALIVKGTLRRAADVGDVELPRGAQFITLVCQEVTVKEYEER